MRLGLSLWTTAKERGKKETEKLYNCVEEEERRNGNYYIILHFLQASLKIRVTNLRMIKETSRVGETLYFRKEKQHNLLEE
jgi:hypothetical protein